MRFTINGIHNAFSILPYGFWIIRRPLRFEFELMRRFEINAREEYSSYNIEHCYIGSERRLAENKHLRETATRMYSCTIWAVLLRQSFVKCTLLSHVLTTVARLTIWSVPLFVYDDIVVFFLYCATVHITTCWLILKFHQKRNRIVFPVLFIFLKRY